MLRRMYLAFKRALQQNSGPTNTARNGRKVRNCAWCGHPVYPSNRSVTNVHDHRTVYHYRCHIEMIMVLGL